MVMVLLSQLVEVGVLSPPLLLIGEIHGASPTVPLVMDQLPLPVGMPWAPSTIKRNNAEQAEQQLATLLHAKIRTPPRQLQEEGQLQAPLLQPQQHSTLPSPFGPL